VLNGASPQAAKAIELQTYARESGGTVEAVSQSADATRHGSFAYDSDDGFWLSNGSDRAFIGYGASMNDVSDFLGNSPARDLGMQYASSRLVAKQARDNAFYDGVVSGHAKVRADAIRRAEQSQTLNLNDPRTQALMVNAAVAGYRDNFFETGLKGLELASYAVGGAGLLLGGARLAGRGAMELAKSGFRGSFIHGSSKTAAVWSATKGGTQLYAGYQVADAGLGMLTDPSGTAAAMRQGIKTGQHIYHEGVRNGGFTYATGVTGELDVGTKVNLALGGYLSVDLKTMDFNYGIYGTGELGSKLGLPNPTASRGWEHTVFTTSKFQDALVGKYSIHGAGDNYRNTGRALTGAYISAAGGAISGYQFTSELKNASIKTGFARDPQAYTNFGYGAIYDSKLGLVGADTLKEFLQELLGD